jgi:hypothetical protein
MNLRDFKGKKTSSSDAQSVENDLRARSKTYSGMSQDALNKALLDAVSESKRSGRFDKEKLKGFAAAVGPSLTDEQRARLDALINSL